MRPLLLLALLAPGSAYAATLRVGTARTYPTIGAALNVAVQGDTISVDPGVYDEGTLYIDQSGLQILSTSGSDFTLVRGSNAGTLFVVDGANDVLIRGFTVQNSSGDQGFDIYSADVYLEDIVADGIRNQGSTWSGFEGGAMLIATDSYVSWVGGTITNMRADGDGGAIYADASTLNLTSVTISGSRTDGYGAAIYAYASDLSVTSCWFSGGDAVLSGGGLALDDSTLEMSDTTMSGNVANDGGALAGDGLFADLDAVTATGNASTFGGAIELTDGESTITNSLVSSNTADDGAGFALFGGTHDLTTVDIEDNIASGDGGGIWASSNTILVASGLDVAGNSAADGAGLWWASTGELDIGSSVFDLNKATGAGGAMWLEGTLVRSTLTLTTFTTNSATGTGGAINAGRGTRLTVSGSEFDGNTGLQGGAINAANLGTLDVKNSSFCGNTALGGEGGAMRVGSGVTTASTTNTVWSGNSATGLGGAIFTQSNLSVVNVDVLGSSATTGAVYFKGAGGKFWNSMIAGTFSGGGLGSDLSAISAGLSASYDLFDANTGGNFVGSASLIAGVGFISAPPQLYAWSNDATCANDDWRPLATSPLIDAGDPTLHDRDGTRSDIGAYGGSGSASTFWTDADNDGYVYVYDCDDADAGVNPGASEVCDGVDNDCDALIDDADPSNLGGSIWYADSDGDGYGDPRIVSFGCTAPIGTTADSTDCDDQKSAVHPGAAEVCDHVDNDCDGDTDDADRQVIGQQSWFLDSDGDGWGGDAILLACFPVNGTVSTTGDCDDGDPTRNPGVLDLCNGIDDDCNGVTDDNASATWFTDADGDGFGDPNNPILSCTQPTGTVADHGDCDDSNPTVFSGAVEVCNSGDDDCNGAVDDNAIDALDWYRDTDADGYGANYVATACDAPRNSVPLGGDCDDQNDAVYPNAPESCSDAIDANCDGVPGDVDADSDGVHGCEDCDDADPTTGAAGRWYADADQDGLGDDDSAVEACIPPDGFIDVGGDCDDSDANVLGAATWYSDDDLDGFGDGETGLLACRGPEGTVTDGTDCDDDDARRYPGAEEVCDDGIDTNCDGSADDQDLDQDGTIACEDCNDADGTAFPGNTEVCDEVDNDCNGLVDDDVTDAFEFYVDADSDGYGAETIEGCTQPDGTAELGGDCGDDDPTIYPGAYEVVGDGVDQDCDGEDSIDDTGYGFELSGGGGCSCGEGGSASTGLLALLAVFTLRRRR